MKTLYLHIGTMKTGTTAIQTFLEKNSEFLERQSCVYPIFPYKFKNRAHRRNGNFLDLVYTDSRGDSSEERNHQMVEDCLGTIKKLFKKYDKVVLSDEILFWNLRKNKYRRRTEMLLKCAEENKFTIKVIVYFRKQSELLDAHWNQLIKQNSVSKSFEEFKKEQIEKEKYDYYGRLTEISKLFGKENIIVRRFQKYSLVGGSSVTDFLNIIGIKIPENIDTSIGSTEKNVRLSDNLANIKRYINLFSDATRDGTDIARKAFEKAEKRGPNNEYRSFMLSPEEIKEFMEIYNEGNDRVAKEYICDGKPLFDEEIKDVEKWQIDNPAILEDVIKSYGAMFGEILEVLEKQDDRIKELEKKSKKRSIIKKIKNRKKQS